MKFYGSETLAFLRAHSKACTERTCSKSQCSAVIKTCSVAYFRECEPQCKLERTLNCATLALHCIGMLRSFERGAFERGAFWERSVSQGSVWERSFTVQSTAPTGARFHTAQRSVVKKERSAENRSVIAVQSKCKYSAV